MSARCRPVVGSSRMYRLRPPRLIFPSSCASLTRWASPPAFRRAGEDLPDGVVHPYVRRRVGGWGAPYRGLVYVDHVSQVLDTLDGVVRPGQHPAVVKDRVELLVQDLVDERALARARHAGHADE